MLALPDRLPRRCLGNPELPVRLAGLLVAIDARARRLQLGRHRTLDACDEKTVYVDVSALRPERYHLGELYEFIGVLLPLDAAAHNPPAATPAPPKRLFVVSVFWGRRIDDAEVDQEHPEELLEHMARCIDAVEVSRCISAYSSSHQSRGEGAAFLQQ